MLSKESAMSLKLSADFDPFLLPSAKSFKNVLAAFEILSKSKEDSFLFFSTSL